MLIPVQTSSHRRRCSTTTNMHPTQYWYGPHLEAMHHQILYKILSMGSNPILNGGHKRAHRATQTAIRPLSHTGKTLPATVPSTGLHAPWAAGASCSGICLKAALAFSSDQGCRWIKELGGNAGPAHREAALVKGSDKLATAAGANGMDRTDLCRKSTNADQTCPARAAEISTMQSRSAHRHLST